MNFRAYISRIGLEGALMVLAPVPLFFPGVKPALLPPVWQLVIAAAAGIACFACGLTLLRKPIAGKVLGITAAAACCGAALPYIVTNQFIALTAGVLLISCIFFLLDFKLKLHPGQRNERVDRCLHRARWGALLLPGIVVLGLFFDPKQQLVFSYALAGSVLIVLVLFVHWVLHYKSFLYLALPAAGLIALGLVFIFSFQGLLPLLAAGLGLICIGVLPRKDLLFEKKNYLWDELLSHPARILLTSFLGLCAVGTCLMLLPFSTRAGTIKIVDAAFTSVSAVCVTGLIVLDTARDFTLAGQFFILLLIQLGGLGIMSITTVTLHAMGRRLSLKQERLLTSITDTDHQDLVYSLVTILKFTFIAEGIGAALLTLLFCFTGDGFFQALWRGLFTAISAFCNAGFALQTDSLIPYQTNGPITLTISFLIIFGGMAPATSLLIPGWVQGKQTPISARLALITTVILLGAGTFFMLALEWNGVLGNLSFIDKIHNAWFQSVTLRTAGFNSIEMGKITGPTYIVMLVLMFIGGSPGGTAGGVKTTTMGILALTFFANIRGREKIIINNRRIPPATVFRAITIIASGIIVLFFIILMLEVTQPIPDADLIFEATSAIGTVGLSTGITSMLDEIGRIIIIIAMFAGRVGPMTLFTVLSTRQSAVETQCPDVTISLT